MDIMRPPLEQQVSPAPGLLIRNNVDVPSLIGKALSARPNATVDNVVKQLSVWGVQASGIIVSMSMLKWKEQAAATTLAEGQSSAVAPQQTQETDLYCTCDESPCRCGKSSPPWWHQYCGAVRVTADQLNARDEFFEHATNP